MRAANFTDITVDPRGGVVLAPIARLPVAGTLGFLPGGNLLVLERRFDDACVVVHELGPGGAGFVELRRATLKGFRGSPLGCAVSPAGTRACWGWRRATAGWCTSSGSAGAGDRPGRRR